MNAELGLAPRLHGILGALVRGILLDFDVAWNRQSDQFVKGNPFRRPKVLRDQQVPRFVATGGVAGEEHEIRWKLTYRVCLRSSDFSQFSSNGVQTPSLPRW